MAVLSGVVLGCSGAQPHAEAEPGGKLPFIVYLRTLNLPSVREDLEGESAEDKRATPALFGDPRELTADLATSLKKARLFSDVITATVRISRP